MEGADAVYPAGASALSRGRRLRRAVAGAGAGAGAGEPRARRRTVPVTFAEIKEVDEDSAEQARGARRRPDVLGGRAAGAGAPGRRRGREPALRELSPPGAGQPPRAGSEPADTAADT